MFISLKHVSQNQIVEIVKEDNSGHFKNQALNISKLTYITQKQQKLFTFLKKNVKLFMNTGSKTAYK